MLFGCTNLTANLLCHPLKKVKGDIHDSPPLFMLHRSFFQTAGFGGKNSPINRHTYFLMERGSSRLFLLRRLFLIAKSCP